MKYTARDHAYIYGVIAQELLSVRPDALDTLEESIKIYGLQRGNRMGETAEAFGDPRSMQTYMVYGEWAPAPGEMEIDKPEESPSAVWNVRKCPWNEEWTEQGMLDVGQYYCKYVDRELVHGFNPKLELETGATQTGGDGYCYFRWTGADMTPEHKEENAEITRKVGDVRLKTWAYHMGHMYKTMQETIQKKLGKDVCCTVYQRADRRIEEHYGLETVELLHVALLLDYWRTPSLKNTQRLADLFDTGDGEREAEKPAGREK